MLKLAQQAYTRGVCGRYRVLLGQLLAIERRCDRESRCARQAAELIRLLLAHQTETHAATTTTPARVYRAPPEGVAEGVFYSTAPRGGSRRRPLTRAAASEEPEAETCERRDAEVFALLDAPDRLLSKRRTRALALATVREAMLQALQDHSMQHEQAAMRTAVLRLEGLELQLLTGARFQSWADEEGEEEQQALLKHLGRGIELMERIARAQATLG